MPLNVPKVLKDRVCNSHLPIRELHVHIWGMRMGKHGRASVSRITKCWDLLCCSRLKELKGFSPADVVSQSETEISRF